MFSLKEKDVRFCNNAPDEELQWGCWIECAACTQHHGTRQGVDDSHALFTNDMVKAHAWLRSLSKVPVIKFTGSPF